MKKSLLLLALACACAWAQTGTIIANAGSTGTTVYKLAKLTGAPSTAVITATTDTSGAIGIVVGGAGTTGSAVLVNSGYAQCVFDGATTAGHYVTISGSTAGDCHDAGASAPSTQSIGFVLSTNGGAGTYNILMVLGGAASSGGVSSVATTCGVTGGTITSTGTLSGQELVNAQSGTSYAIVTGDCAKVVVGTNSSAQAYSIAQAGSTGFAPGWFSDVRSAGAGTITITPATSTVNGASTLALTSGQSARIVSDGTNYVALLGATAGGGSGTVTNIATSCGVTGGPITATGTISGQQSVNAQSGTSYAIVTGDCGKLVSATNAASQAYTIAQAGTTGFLASWFTDLRNNGTGTLTLTPTTSTINGGATLSLTTGQYARIVSDGTNYVANVGTSFSWTNGSGSAASTNPINGITTLATDPTVVPRYFTGSGAPGISCTAGRDFYTDTTGLDVYFCDATNTWKKANGGGSSSMFTTSGTGEYWPFGLSLGANTGALSGTNKVACFEFSTPSGFTANKVLLIPANSGADTGNWAIGVYSSAGSVLAQGAVTGTGTGNYKLATFGSPWVATTGTYLLCWSSDSVSTLFQSNTNGTSQNAFVLADVGAESSPSAARAFFCTNSSTTSGSTTLPSTCGTRITSGTGGIAAPTASLVP